MLQLCLSLDLRHGPATCGVTACAETALCEQWQGAQTWWAP